MKKYLAAIGVLFFLVFASCSGGGGGSSNGSDTNTPTNEESFTNGDITLKASVAASDSTKTVPVKDSDGKTVLTMDVTKSSATFTFPDISTPTVINFDSPLPELPTDYAAKRMAVYVADQIYSSTSKSQYKDHPGCDFPIGTKCMLGCCAEHDECYDKHDCTAFSWGDGKTNMCDYCNGNVVVCMVIACSAITVDNQPNNCYDHRCKKHYDCPPDYDTCDCKDICAESSTTTSTSTTTTYTTTTSTVSSSTSSTSSSSTSTTTSTATTTTTMSHYTSLNMIYVPTGSFQRDATLTNISTVSAFYISQYEITRAQFLAIMGTDPSLVIYSSDSSDPVQTVNWYHAIAFCNKLSIAEGLTPVYIVSGVNFSALSYAEIPTANNVSWDAATANWSANGYRLPTEMEWMWAAMGATSGYGYTSGVYTNGYGKHFAGSTGNNNIADYVWYVNNSDLTSHPVGTKLSNELDLYDITGNVSELCWDWFGSYPSGTLSDYRGADTGTHHSMMGGNWGSTYHYCILSSRGNGPPYSTHYQAGFRVVRH